MVTTAQIGGGDEVERRAEMRWRGNTDEVERRVERMRRSGVANGSDELCDVHTQHFHQLFVIVREGTTVLLVVELNHTNQLTLVRYL